MMKLTLSILLLFSNLFVNGQSNDSIKKINNMTGIKMPEILDKSISGKTWNYNALRGKVVVVNFWFIRCMPCMKEVKYLNKLKKKYKNDNFVLLSIAPETKQDLIDFNSDSNTKYSAIRKDFAKAEIEYEIIPECKDKKLNIDDKLKFSCNRISSLFNVTSYPTTFIINQKGVIEYIKTGFGNKSSGLNKEIEYDPGYEKIIDKLLMKTSIKSN